MFEVIKYTPAMDSSEILFSALLLQAVEFLKGLDQSEREACFLAYAGDGTEGV